MQLGKSERDKNSGAIERKTKKMQIVHKDQELKDILKGIHDGEIDGEKWDKSAPPELDYDYCACDNIYVEPDNAKTLDDISYFEVRSNISGIRIKKYTRK